VKPFEYVCRTYQVPACVGRRVMVHGKPGTIVEDRGHHIGVNFDADKPGRVSPCHPTSEVRYLEQIREPRKVSRSSRRYQEYLNADCGETFAEWLGIGRRRKACR